LFDGLFDGLFFAGSTSYGTAFRFGGCFDNPRHATERTTKYRSTDGGLLIFFLSAVIRQRQTGLPTLQSLLGYFLRNFKRHTLADTLSRGAYHLQGTPFYGVF
jgi:hypothetical protein